MLYDAGEAACLGGSVRGGGRFQQCLRSRHWAAAACSSSPLYHPNRAGLAAAVWDPGIGAFLVALKNSQADRLSCMGGSWPLRSAAAVCMRQPARPTRCSFTLAPQHKTHTATAAHPTARAAQASRTGPGAGCTCTWRRPFSWPTAAACCCSPTRRRPAAAAGLAARPPPLRPAAAASAYCRWKKRCIGWYVIHTKTKSSCVSKPPCRLTCEVQRVPQRPPPTPALTPQPLPHRVSPGAAGRHHGAVPGVQRADAAGLHSAQVGALRPGRAGPGRFQKPLQQRANCSIQATSRLHSTACTTGTRQSGT
jgi:hypothetical protein